MIKMRKRSEKKNEGTNLSTWIKSKRYFSSDYFIVSESINRLSFSEKLTLYQQRHSEDLKLTIQNLLPTYYGN